MGTRGVEFVMPHHLVVQHTDESRLEQDSNPYFLHKRIPSLLEPSSGCVGVAQGERVSLVVATMSEAKNKERRDVHRKWMKAHAYLGAKRVFVVGRSSGVVQQLLQDEAGEHQDILQLDTDEVYVNLVLKTIGVMQWFSEHCPMAEYFMKTDDNVAVNIEAILKYLDHRTSAFIMGYCKLNKAVNRWAWLIHYVNPRQYTQEYYPPFCEGAGYVFSSLLARDVAAAVPLVPIIPIEDRYVGILLEQLKYGVSILSKPDEFSHDYSFLWHHSLCDGMKRGKHFVIECKYDWSVKYLLDCIDS